MEKITLLIWIIGIALFVIVVTGMVISITAHVTTNKANYYWTEKRMLKMKIIRLLKMKIIRLFHKKG